MRRDSQVIQGIGCCSAFLYVLVNCCSTTPTPGSPEDPLLSVSTHQHASIPPGLAIARKVGPVLPVKIRRRGRPRIPDRNHTTVSIGGALCSCLVLVAIFAPISGRRPTPWRPHKRTRAPSATFGSARYAGPRHYSRVIYGARVALTVGFRWRTLATLPGLAIGIRLGFRARGRRRIIMRLIDGADGRYRRFDSRSR